MQRRRRASNREADEFFASATDEEITDFPGLPVPGLAPPQWEVKRRADGSEPDLVVTAAHQPASNGHHQLPEDDGDFAIPKLEDLK